MRYYDEAVSREAAFLLFLTGKILHTDVQLYQTASFGEHKRYI